MGYKRRKLLKNVAQRLHRYWDVKQKKLHSRAVAVRVTIMQSKDAHCTCKSILTSQDLLFIHYFSLSSTQGRNHVITTKVEHPSVMEVCRYLEANHGIRVTYLDVDKYGMIDIEDLKSHLNEKTALGN